MIQQEQSEIYRNKNYVRVPHLVGYGDDSGQILQVNIRWKAFDELYQIYILLHFSKRKISAKSLQQIDMFNIEATFSQFFFFRFRRDFR